MSGSGHGGAASGLASSWTECQKPREGSQVSPYLAFLWLSGLLKGISESGSENLHGNGLAIALHCPQKGRLLMKPNHHPALRVQRAVLIQEISLKGVMQRAGHASSFSALISQAMQQAWDAFSLEEEQPVVSQVTTG